MSGKLRQLKQGEIVQYGDILGNPNGPVLTIPEDGIGEPHMRIFKIFRPIKND